MEAARDNTARLKGLKVAAGKLTSTRVLFWLLVTLLSVVLFEPLLNALGFLLASAFLILLNPICVIALIFSRRR